MNWLIKLGEWWEAHRVLRKNDFKIFEEAVLSSVASQMKDIQSLVGRWRVSEERIHNLQDNLGKEEKERVDVDLQIARKISEIEKKEDIPESLLKELMLLKIRLDRLELLTGLKREPAPSHVNGTARIG